MSQSNTDAQLNQPVLRRGIQSTTVAGLQGLLTYWQTYTGPLNGIFDLAVENAVKAFQHQVFLKEDGIVGPLTWQALHRGSPVNMPVLSQGSYGQAVLILQRTLQSTGDYCTVIDGDFGLNTEAAVRRFQERSSLLANGVVDDLTWQALSRTTH